MIIYAIVAIAIILPVLLLSLMTISKGYAYKHTVDPLPEEKEEEENDLEKDRTN